MNVRWVLRAAWVGVLCILGATAALAQGGLNLDPRPIIIDNSDGCGSARATVEGSRRTIQRDRFYKESQPWFQSHLRVLEKCIAEAPARRAAAIARKQEWEASKANAFAATSRLVQQVVLVGLPLALFLSYAQSAGVAGTGAAVRLRDWKGTPLSVWGALLTTAMLIQFLVNGSYNATYEKEEIVTTLAWLSLLIIGPLAALFVLGLLVFFLRYCFWDTFKGSFMLLHYLFVRHPTEVYLPNHALVPIARRNFGQAIRTHGVGIGPLWRELVTPNFVRRHKLERAVMVKAQLDADTSILQSAMARESSRAAVADLR